LLTSIIAQGGDAARVINLLLNRGLLGSLGGGLSVAQWSLVANLGGRGLLLLCFNGLSLATLDLLGSTIESGSLLVHSIELLSEVEHLNIVLELEGLGLLLPVLLLFLCEFLPL
jgi:hypothetical protein